MLVTIDALSFSRRRDALRLLRRPHRLFAARPAFARSLLRAQEWRSSDLRQVVVIAAWEDVPADVAVQAGAAETWRGVFEVQRSHGTLHGADPLGPSALGAPAGAGAILTCGNVRLRGIPAFMRQNLRVVKELNRAPGLLDAFGVMGLWKQGPWMCTLSFWEDLDQGLGFAYRNSPSHSEAIKKMRGARFGTRETYFARLGLVAQKGTMAGRPLFATAERVAA